MFHIGVNSKFFKKEWFDGIIESACLATEVKPIAACVKYGADMSVGNCHEHLEILSHQLMKHYPNFDPTALKMIPMTTVIKTSGNKNTKEDVINCIQTLLKGYTIDNLKTATHDTNLNFPNETKQLVNKELKHRIKKHIKDKVEENREEEITV